MTTIKQYTDRTLYTQRPKITDDPTMQGLIEVVGPDTMVVFTGNQTQVDALYAPVS